MRNNINKFAASLGQYNESICKNIASIFLSDAKRSIGIHKDDRFVAHHKQVSIDDAIEMMRVDDNTKSRLRKFYSGLANVWVDLHAVEYEASEPVGTTRAFFHAPDYISISIRVAAKSYNELTSLLYDIRNEIVRSLRHELEHYAQMIPVRLKTLRNYDDEFAKWHAEHQEMINTKYVPFIADIYGYYANPSEIGAYVSSLYMKSKELRIKFSSILENYFLVKVENQMRRRLGNDPEAETIIEGSCKKLLAKYMEHARQRYGNRID